MKIEGTGYLELQTDRQPLEHAPPTFATVVILKYDNIRKFTIRRIYCYRRNGVYRSSDGSNLDWRQIFDKGAHHLINASLSDLHC